MRFDWLKHAFAIEPAGEPVPTPAQRQVIEHLCREVVSRELTTPALLFLESVRPLHFVTAQLLQFFAPLLSGFGDSRVACNELTAFLEHRGAVDYLCRQIEELDRQRSSKDVRGSP